MTVVRSNPPNSKETSFLLVPTLAADCALYFSVELISGTIPSAFAAPAAFPRSARGYTQPLPLYHPVVNTKKFPRSHRIPHAIYVSAQRNVPHKV